MLAQAGLVSRGRPYRAIAQARQKQREGSLKPRKVKPIYFAERPHDGSEPYNASDIVAIGDSRFLFCDNNISDALYELRLTPEGQAAGRGDFQRER